MTGSDRRLTHYVYRGNISETQTTANAEETVYR